MKKIIYSLLFLIGNLCFSQTIKECEGFIDWRYNKNIKVFSDSEGKFIIDKIKNDNKNENYLFFRIIEKLFSTLPNFFTLVKNSSFGSLG